MSKSVRKTENKKAALAPKNPPKASAAKPKSFSSKKKISRAIPPNVTTLLDDDGSSLLYIPDFFTKAGANSVLPGGAMQSSAAGGAGASSSSAQLELPKGASSFSPKASASSKLPQQLSTAPSYTDTVAVLHLLHTGIPWEQGSVKLFGKSIPEPRLTCYYGEFGYKYSGRNLDPRSFDKAPPIVRDIKAKIEHFLQVKFNSVLINRYRSGEDSLGWHADDEAVYGKNPQIASVSFGEERAFQLRQIPPKKVAGGTRSGDEVEKAEVALTHGSLLFMGGPIQHKWQHCLPKRKKVVGERINLTFRTVVKP